MAPSEQHDAEKDAAVHVGTEDVRQGETTGHVRWVLRLSLVFSVLAVFAVWAWFAFVYRHTPKSNEALQPVPAHGAPASSTPAARAGNGPAAMSASHS